MRIKTLINSSRSVLEQPNLYNFGALPTRKEIQFNLQHFSGPHYPKMSNNQLLRSIRTNQQRMEEHIEKLKNPSAYDIGWNDKTDKMKNGLLKHWGDEIGTFYDNIQKSYQEINKREIARRKTRRGVR